jgi:RNA polymerase sigma-32 factor
LASDDDEREGSFAPIQYLEDKSSDVAQYVEKENWEVAAANRLRAALATLDERNAYIVQRRWLDEDKATLQELADHYQVSAERIRQLEKNAMKKLKAAME